MEGFKEFSRFLDLLEGPPTTIAPRVKTLRITNFFLRYGTWKRRKAGHKLASKLSQLRSIQTVSQQWCILPETFLDFILALPAVEISIEDTTIYTSKQFFDLFNSYLVAQGSQNLAIYHLQLEEGPDAFLDHVYLFEKRFHLRAIDSTSLVNFHDVWDPVKSRAKITVETFYLQLYGLGVEQKYLPFLRNFLLEIGPSLDNLAVELSYPHWGRGVLSAYKELDLTSCVALKAVHIGIICMDHRQTALMNTTWKLFEALPPFAIKTIGLIFDIGVPLDDCTAPLISFPWTETIERIQDMFPSSKHIKIKIGCYSDEPKAGRVGSIAQALHSKFMKLPIKVSFTAIIWTSIGSST
ncbi:hypothetical protein C0993_007977, partial [Termitomyces sp. T159_Od127]